MSFEVIVADRDLVPSNAGSSPSCTSSRDEVEIRWAVSKGDFASGPGTDS